MNKLTESPWLIFWLGAFVFVYSWFVSAILQLLVIPILFPQPGLNTGLVVLDSIGFDVIAKAKAAEIAKLGWVEWELRPQLQSPAGIASVFYVFLSPVPSSMLPFNAAVHAMSACVVMAILRNFFSVLPALIGALIFALNPASFEWVAQIHRDGVFILGNLLLILGILRFTRETPTVIGYSKYGYWLIWLLVPIVGTLLIWVARTYWVQVALVTLILTVTFVIFATFFYRVKLGHSMALFVWTVFLVSAFQVWLIRSHTPYDPVDYPSSDRQADRQEDRPTNLSGWQPTNGLPKIIEDRFYRIASIRRGVLSSGGNTLVDIDIPFNSASAVVRYIPRALQLGMFSPFPRLWGGEASTPAMTMARKVVAGVTLLAYVSLLGLSIGLWWMRNNLSLWVMVGSCLTGILIYAVTYPNIGTMMRFRYGFYMLLIAFGVAFLFDLWVRHKSGDRSR